MTDWAVWPIFIFQIGILSLFLFNRKTTLCSIPLKTIEITLLMAVCLLTAASLLHDSTSLLHLHF